MQLCPHARYSSFDLCAKTWGRQKRRLVVLDPILQKIAPLNLNPRYNWPISKILLQLALARWLSIEQALKLYLVPSSTLKACPRVMPCFLLSRSCPIRRSSPRRARPLPRPAAASDSSDIVKIDPNTDEQVGSSFSTASTFNFANKLKRICLRWPEPDMTQYSCSFVEQLQFLLDRDFSVTK